MAGSDLVLTTRTALLVEQHNLVRSLGWLSDGAGLRKIGLHDLRHTVATLLFSMTGTFMARRGPTLSPWHISYPMFTSRPIPTVWQVGIPSGLRAPGHPAEAYPGGADWRPGVAPGRCSDPQSCL